MSHRRGQLGQTKIQNLRLPALDEKDIRRLHVAVHDSFRVSRIEAIRNLNPDLQEFGHLDGLALNAMLERPPLEELHGDKRPALEFADIVNRTDIGVVESGRGARFAAKPLVSLGIVRNVVRQEFQRNTAAEARVFGFVHDAHTSTAQFFQNAIVGNGAAKNRGSICHRRCIVRQRLHAGNRSRVHAASIVAE